MWTTQKKLKMKHSLNAHTQEDEKNGNTHSQFLPISINIARKKIVLIGGGKVACHKVTILNRFTNKITVIAPEFHPDLEVLPIELIRKSYEPDDLNGAFLVYICTENEKLNIEIKAECEKRGIWANVCDNPALCDFISPAIYREGNVTIAVSSDVRDVRQAIHIRNQIQELANKKIIRIHDTLSTNQ